MPFGRIVSGTLLAVGLATTMSVGSYWTAQAMQSDLTDQAHTALQARHLTATVTFSGRDAYVWADTLTARADAIAALKTIPGVRVVLVGEGAPPVTPGSRPSAAPATSARPASTPTPTSIAIRTTRTSATASPSAAVPASTVTTLTPPHTASSIPSAIPTWPAIPFDGDSPNVDAAAKAELVEIAQFMVAHPTMKVRLTGYTDTSHTEAERQALGLARAKSAAAVLAANHISSSRTTVASRGGNDPVASNATAQGRALNRRVNVSMTEES
jgi:outer membrane protein OmpA-like peptidoglycan-associated protein